MKQLLIIAVETDEPITLNEMLLEAPMADVRAARGEIITDPQSAKQVAEASKRCMDGLLDGTNVTIVAPLSEAQKVSAGMKMLGAWLDRDAMARKHRSRQTWDEFHANADQDAARRQARQDARERMG